MAPGADQAAADESDEVRERDVLLISWNVAGWTSCGLQVKSHWGGLAEYLRRLGSPAIVCLQETKVQAKALQNAMAAQSLGAIVDGYRSYWAFNRDSDSRKACLQGVATWVRDDVPVLGATQEVFGVEELDNQGRCLLTDHGALAILNVYVPHVQRDDDDGQRGGAKGYGAKLRFLEALGRRMEQLQANGKRVLLCGDLNLTHRAFDQLECRRVRWVDSEGFVDLPCSARGNPDEPAVDSVTCAKEIRCSDGVPSRLGPVPGFAEQWVAVRDICQALDLPVAAVAEGAECLHIREGGCVPWLRRLISSTAAGSESPAWADVFAEVHPEARNRFTCWAQMANLRYTNCGTRIDYAIVDRETFETCVVRSPSCLLPGASVAPCPGSAMANSATTDATSAPAAQNAATCFGGWLPANSNGLELQAIDMRLTSSQFPQQPYTGLIYTPPSYSDHIAVSVLFSAKLLEAPVRAGGESQLPPPTAKETRASRPWEAQRSLASLFSGGGAKVKAKADAPAVQAEAEAKDGAKVEVTSEGAEKVDGSPTIAAVPPTGTTDAAANAATAAAALAQTALLEEAAASRAAVKDKAKRSMAALFATPARQRLSQEATGATAAGASGAGREADADAASVDVQAPAAAAPPDPRTGEAEATTPEEAAAGAPMDLFAKFAFAGAALPPAASATAGASTRGKKGAKRKR